MSYSEIDKMTLPQAIELFEYWREYPPLHEMVKSYLKIKKPLTMEEEIAQGAMGPAEFAEYAKRTGGRIEGVGPI